MSTTTTTTTMEVTATRDESEPKVTPSAMAAVPPVVRDIIVALEERLEKHNENRKVVQNELHAICEEWRKQADDLEERINKELQVKFTEEDDRLLKALNALRESTLSEKEGERSAAARRARAELLVKQSYSFVHTDNGKDAGPIDFVNSYRLNVKEELAEEWLDFDTLPSVKVERVTAGRVYVKLGAKEDEIEVLTTHGLDGLVTQKASWSLTGSTFKANEYLLRKEGKNYYSFLPDAMRENAAYTVRVKSACSTRESKWSEGAEFLTSAFSYFCTWKECPDNVNKNINYTVSAANPKMATTTGSIGSCCTVVGNLTLPQNKITSWSIRILKSKKNNGSGIYIGVAPSDIDQNDYNNRDKCGWYFICYSSALYSGPPHSYNDKEYDLGKEEENTFTQETVLVL